MNVHACRGEEARKNREEVGWVEQCVGLQIKTKKDTRKE